MNEIRIGDLVTLDGRTFTVRGFDPMSLPDQMVELVDRATGDSVRIPLERLEAASAHHTGRGGHKRLQRARLRHER